MLNFSKFETEFSAIIALEFTAKFIFSMTSATATWGMSAIDAKEAKCMLWLKLSIVKIDVNQFRRTKASVILTNAFSSAVFLKPSGSLVKLTLHKVKNMRKAKKSFISVLAVRNNCTAGQIVRVARWLLKTCFHLNWLPWHTRGNDE